MKNFYLTPIKGYQYISKFLPGNCRYYPTCSEYAKWLFEFDKPHTALLNSTLRILRCNQLFKGGIDYPLVHFTPPKCSHLLKPKPFYGKINIHYWFVPKEGTSLHYVLKDFDAIK